MPQSASSQSEILTNTVLNWLRRHRQDIVLQSETIPFAASREWEFSPDGAVLRHKTGRFFSICGVTFTSTPTEHKAMELTLIDQQEIGILGFIVAKSGGQLAFLCQAKAEPGNIELVQLAPTLQATASNYQQIHGGLAQPFLDY